MPLPFCPTNKSEKRLASVDLDLKKMCVLRYFHDLIKIRSDVHSCVFCALSKLEKTIGLRIDSSNKTKQ